MTRLSTAQLVAHALEQIRAADMVLACHYRRGPTCVCGRAMPCSHANAWRSHHQRHSTMLTRLDQPIIGRASAPRTIAGAITATHEEELGPALPTNNA